MERSTLSQKLRENIRDVPGFPKAGITFYDITTLLRNGPLFAELIHSWGERYGQKGGQKDIDGVVCIESRGFIFGGALGQLLGKPIIPMRKPGKLPHRVERESFELEYGADCLEIHADALTGLKKVIVIDDVIATGGTAKAAITLVERLGGEVVECCFLMELAFLSGREKIAPTPVHSLVVISG